MASISMINAAVIPILIECLCSKGISPKEIENHTGISQSCLDDLDIKIPIDQHLRLWKYTCAITGDPSLAIHLREEYGNSRIHFVNSMAANSRNALEAIQNYRRYSRIVSDVINIEIVETSQLIEIHYQIAAPHNYNPWMPEHAFFQILKFGTELTGESYRPELVTFSHSCPTCLSDYEAVFQTTVKFDQSRNMFVSRREDMLRPFKHRNPHLQQVLKKQADLELAKLEKDQSFVDQVREIIIRQLPTGEMDNESVASGMKMSRTTLYRKLKAESFSYQMILTDIRKELATGYIQSGMTVSQIAFLLGYSNASNFVIAFKRWFGKSPGSYRSSMADT